MIGRRWGNLALVVLGAVASAALAGEAAAPVVQQGDMLDQLKRVDVGGIQFKFGGEARLRYERWSDFDFDEYRPVDGRGRRNEDLFLSRLRLSVEAKLTEQVTVFIEGQDSRVWGYDDRRFTALNAIYAPGETFWPYKDHLDLRQGYVLLKPFDGVPMLIKAGRQDVNLGDGRLQGANGWSNTPPVFDALALVFPLEPVTIVAWGGKAVLFPDNRGFNDHLSQFDYYGIYTMWKGIPALSALDVYWLHLRDDGNPLAVLRPAPGVRLSEEDIEIHALGTRIKGALTENLRWGIEPVIEFGEVGPLTLQAWALHTELSFALPDVPLSPTITTEYNIASGDRSGIYGPNALTDTKLTTFFPWFPNYHGLFGIMDMFQWSNVRHWKLGCTMHPAEPLKIEVAGHVFYVDSEGEGWFNGRTNVPAPLGGSAMANRATAPGTGKHVGEEVDLVVTYEIGERTTVEAGYAHFFDASFIRNTGASGGADFLYAMTTFKF